MCSSVSVTLVGCIIIQCDAALDGNNYKMLISKVQVVPFITEL